MFWTIKSKTIAKPRLKVRKYFTQFYYHLRKKFSPYGGMSNHSAASTVWIPSIFDRPVKYSLEKFNQTASGYLSNLYSLQCSFDNMDIRDINFEA